MSGVFKIERMENFMNKYETIFLMKDDIAEEERNNVIDTIKNYLEENGKITKIEDLGIKKLAYEVRKYKEAYYYLIEFESTSEIIPELERKYRITDEIIKFIVIRIED